MSHGLIDLIGSCNISAEHHHRLIFNTHMRHIHSRTHSGVQIRLLYKQIIHYPAMSPLVSLTAGLFH